MSLSLKDLTKEKRRLFLSRKAVFLTRVFEYSNKYPEIMLIEFYNYWTERDDKWIMRYEKEETWSYKHRLNQWIKTHKK